MIFAYISAGNSDDTLPQAAWSAFTGELVRLVTGDGRFETVHGIWYSESSSAYQNLCICAEVREQDLPALRTELRALGSEFGLTLALAVAPRTEFLG